MIRSLERYHEYVCLILISMELFSFLIAPTLAYLELIARAGTTVGVFVIIYGDKVRLCVQPTREIFISINLSQISILICFKINVLLVSAIVSPINSMLLNNLLHLIVTIKPFH